MNLLTPDNLREILNGLVNDLSTNRTNYIKKPHDHSRKRKLSFGDIINIILQMSGGSINHELLNFFNCAENTPTSASFVQQRSKILPEAFESLFHSFIEITNQGITYKGFRLFAVDGSDLHIPTNKDDPDSYFPRINDQRPYNLLHLNALFDICQGTYIDSVVQRSRVSNENQALIEMIDRHQTSDPVIVIADRGYESYNALAHIQEKGWKFLFRIKDASSKGGIAEGLDLPDENEFDFFIDLHLTAGRTKEHWQLYKNKNSYKRISHPEKFDYFVAPDGTRDIYKLYHLPFRIIKIQLEDNVFETIITNLPASSFSKDDIKQLYSMRWGIETSFRHLKYTLGLLNFHARKTDLVFQEIYAHLIMYNFVSLVVLGQKVEKQQRKHEYKSSFSVAIHACREFIRNKISQDMLINLILKYLTPIRPGRKAIRRKKKDRSVMSFNYRLS